MQPLCIIAADELDTAADWLDYQLQDGQDCIQIPRLAARERSAAWRRTAATVRSGKIDPSQTIAMLNPEGD